MTHFLLDSRTAFDSGTKSEPVINHALLSGYPAYFAVLSVFVGNPGDPLSQR